jgi:hypothetical protein
VYEVVDYITAVLRSYETRDKTPAVHDPSLSLDFLFALAAMSKRSWSVANAAQGLLEMNSVFEILEFSDITRCDDGGL